MVKETIVRNNRYFLVALLAAGVLGVAAPTAAYAASGEVTVNGTTYTNPDGCYRVGGGSKYVVNDTDETASVYEAQVGNFHKLGDIHPGTSGSFFGYHVTVCV